MKKYKIAIANTRNSKYWKNIDITFDHFIKRLKKPTRTAETQGEYKNMTKSKQDEIKDVGGFVCGYLKEGKRNKNSLQYRSMLTLDADFAEDGFCEVLDLCFDYDYIIYSTRKHEEEKPRYRLIIPFNRTCGPDEYEAVARYIANEIGIDMFDDSTYEPSRLMYYPSVSQDQKYIFESRNKGKEINVDKILKEYDDWKDRSTWYTSSRIGKVLDKQIKKQKDPLEKSGMVGTFCRVYDIETVIDTYLSDVYEKCTTGDRYTYLGGSTYAGAVLYENGTFLYSNHSTDPASNTLCNAFDLVRIHKFGELDENAKENTPSTKLPSYLAMLEFASNDKKVKKLMQKERRESALEDFEDIEDEDYAEDIEENDSWLEKLETNKNGKNLNTINNIVIILKNDPNLKGKIAFNEFTQRPMLKGKTPWNKAPKMWGDEDDSNLRNYIEKVYGIKGEKPIKDAWTIVLYENMYHPIRDYIKGIEWDKESRIETLFIDYLGAEDNEYIREVTKCTLVGAVKRVFEPGAKFDTAIVLIGAQGKGKTEIVKRLGGEWFNNSLTTFKGKDAYEQLQGSWIIELGELEAMRNIDLNTVKHFMTKTEDNFRGAYARHVKCNKRQCIFIGTSNTYDFLKDPTGDRRFYPIDLEKTKITKSIFKDLTKDEIGQIWAEAYYLYKKGEKAYIDNVEILKVAEKEQQGHREDSPFQGIIENYLSILLPERWKNMTISERLKYLNDINRNDPLAEVGTVKRDKVCILEIWVEALGGQPKDLDRAKSNEIKNCILKIDGWVWNKKTMHFGGEYGKQKGFISEEF